MGIGPLAWHRAQRMKAQAAKVAEVSPAAPEPTPEPAPAVVAPAPSEARGNSRRSDGHRR